jgi:hypothetical protein
MVAQAPVHPRSALATDGDVERQLDHLQKGQKARICLSLISLANLVKRFAALFAATR